MRESTSRVSASVANGEEWIELLDNSGDGGGSGGDSVHGKWLAK